jgi:5-methylcytosine-specific restriction enzyme A
MTSGRWSSSTRTTQLPPGWRTRICPRILERDPVCRVCGINASVEVDHVHDPTDHSDDALQGICTNCHKRKTQREAQAGRARKSRRRPVEPHPGLR